MFTSVGVDWIKLKKPAGEFRDKSQEQYINYMKIRLINSLYHWTFFLHWDLSQVITN